MRLSKDESSRPAVDSAFYDACKEGDLELVKDCIRNGANPALRQNSETNSSAFETACLEGHLPVVQYLIEESEKDAEAAGHSFTPAREPLDAYANDALAFHEALTNEQFDISAYFFDVRVRISGTLLMRSASSPKLVSYSTSPGASKSCGQKEQRRHQCGYICNQQLVEKRFLLDSRGARCTVCLFWNCWCPVKKAMST